MIQHTVTAQGILDFGRYLIHEEKSTATLEKYLRDVRAFAVFLSGRPISKEIALDYKQQLLDSGYAIRSVNSMLASLNSFLGWLGLPECRVRTVRQQKQIYCPEEKELSLEEYLRLVAAAGNQPKLQLILKTICGTGIRVSELKYFTLQAVRQGEAVVRCKGKTRTVLIPRQLRRLLLDYAQKEKLRSGPIFVSRNGTPLNRSRVWALMKGLCARAGVDPRKVFPHSLRKLFARTFYGIEKDIAKLADILGHSSIETTRIYIISTGQEHRQKLERLGLIT